MLDAKGQWLLLGDIALIVERWNKYVFPSRTLSTIRGSLGPVVYIHVVPAVCES